MKKIFLYTMIIAAFVSSCSTVYKSGQTVDDVYYSPMTGGGYVAAKPAQQYQEPYRDPEIVMSIRDPRWRDMYDDYAYSSYYSPYYYGYTSDYYYNPYYCPFPVYSYGYVSPYNYGYGFPYGGYNYNIVSYQPINTTPRKTNLDAYKSGYNNDNSTINRYQPAPQKNYNNSNYQYRTTAPSDNYQAPTYNNTEYNNSNINRNYTPSPSYNSGGSSSGGGSGGGVSRPSNGRQ
ncbi:hypothetical protein [Ferruginibacter albus]|uniref:hypothetical protein n=1 Tax=Ferruginibacter albus TaxID=2875540 RepID=UPI001CC7376C|nr:hypothetical protein [Ferruginibacter albus]UAY51132.1 hypothetical protein K9M53_11080 [Ferruginibacter albus]